MLGPGLFIGCKTIGNFVPALRNEMRAFKQWSIHTATWLIRFTYDVEGMLTWSIIHWWSTNEAGGEKANRTRSSAIQDTKLIKARFSSGNGKNSSRWSFEWNVSPRYFMLKTRSSFVLSAETEMAADHNSFGWTNDWHGQIAIKGPPHEKVLSHLCATE